MSTSEIAEPAPFGQPSVLDLFNQEFKELADNKEAFIPVAGYGRTGLQVKYHLPESGKELDDIARKVQRETKENYYRNLFIATDTMIHLCSGLYVQPEDTPEPVMLDPGDTGYPCMFDSRLGEMVGSPIESGARGALRKLFGNNDLAILSHAEKLNRWLQNTKADLTLEVWQMGE